MATGKGVRRSRETTLVRRSTTSSVSMRMLIRTTALPCLTATLRGSNSDQAHPSPFSYKKRTADSGIRPFSRWLFSGTTMLREAPRRVPADHAEAGSAPRAVLDPLLDEDVSPGTGPRAMGRQEADGR